MKIPQELVGSWVRYTSKIDRSYCCAGTPQYRTTLEKKGCWSWNKLYRSGDTDNVVNIDVAETVMDFMYRYGQLKRTVNSVGQYDLEGIMCLSPSLVEQYNKTH